MHTIAQHIHTRTHMVHYIRNASKRCKHFALLSCYYLFWYWIGMLLDCWHENDTKKSGACELKTGGGWKLGAWIRSKQWRWYKISTAAADSKLLAMKKVHLQKRAYIKWIANNNLALEEWGAKWNVPIKILGSIQLNQLARDDRITSWS